MSDYDAGLLSDYGGGNIDWWQDYLRAEIARANDHWREQLAAEKAAAFRRGAEAMREQAAEVLATTHERIEWFNTETNGAPLVVKGERDFVRLGEVHRFIRHEAARIRALPVPEDRNEQG